MPKKLRQESQEEQSARFEAEVQRMIDAGELNPIDADSAVEKLVEKMVNKASERDRWHQEETGN